MRNVVDKTVDRIKKKFYKLYPKIVTFVRYVKKCDTAIQATDESTHVI